MSELIVFVLCLLISSVRSDEPEWNSKNDAKMLRYNNRTNTIEDGLTPVRMRCKCDFSACDCFIEYINWSNATYEARFYFRIDPDGPKKVFFVTPLDTVKGSSKPFELQDGMNCGSLKTDIFDKYCFRAYGRASYSDFNRICLQVGVIIKRDSVVSSDIECIKAWPTGATHMQPSAYENPRLSELNQHLYKLRYSSSSNSVGASLFTLVAALLCLIAANTTH